MLLVRNLIDLLERKERRLNRAKWDSGALAP